MEEMLHAANTQDLGKVMFFSNKEEVFASLWN